MTRTEAARKLKELAHEIYGTLEEAEDILREVAPEELGAEEAYWMSRIDEALLNLEEQIKDMYPNVYELVFLPEVKILK